MPSQLLSSSTHSTSSFFDNEVMSTTIKSHGGWLIGLACIAIVMEGTFLTVAHRQSHARFDTLHQEIMRFPTTGQPQDQQYCDASNRSLQNLEHIFNGFQQELENHMKILRDAKTETMISPDKNIDYLSISNLTSFFLEKSDDLLNAHEEQSQARMQLLQQELQQFFERQIAISTSSNQQCQIIAENMQISLADLEQAMQHLFQMERNSNTTSKEKSYWDQRKKQRDYEPTRAGVILRNAPLLLALLIIAISRLFEKQQEHKWNATLDNLTKEFGQSQDEQIKLEKQKETLEAMLEMSRSTVPYALFLRMQDLEDDVKKWKSDYEIIEKENQQLKATIPGASEALDVQKENAKLQEDIKQLQKQNLKLVGEIAKLKTEKNNRVKTRKRLRTFSFKSH